jgi:hypothetical protein
VRLPFYLSIYPRCSFLRVRASLSCADQKEGPAWANDD